MVFKLSDVLGTFLQAGISKSTTRRLENAFSAEGRASETSQSDPFRALGGSLSGLFGDGQGGSIGSLLSGVLGDAGRVLGDNKKLALGGLGALAGALIGGGGRSLKGALGGGAMAMLGALAYSALKGSGDDPSEVPIGLRQPENSQQEEELEQDAELILQAMINAAKADGQIDSREVQRILGKLEEAGADQRVRDYVLAEVKKPMDLPRIVAAAKGRPQMAAQLYAASLLAIEVDTVAEREYLERLAGGLNLAPDTVAHLEKTVGL
jgi:uncharacterized membrane protein YebE (DUF533 family)